MPVSYVTLVLCLCTLSEQVIAWRNDMPPPPASCSMIVAYWWYRQLANAFELALVMALLLFQPLPVGLTSTIGFPKH